MQSYKPQDQTFAKTRALKAGRVSGLVFVEA